MAKYAIEEMLSCVVILNRAVRHEEFFLASVQPSFRASEEDAP